MCEATVANPRSLLGRLVGGQEYVIVDTDVVDGLARYRPVRRRRDQGMRGEVFPLLASLRSAVSTTRRNMVPSGSIQIATTLTSPV